MKKVIMIILCSMSFSSFASQEIYCPDKIVCTQAGNINSCSAVGGDQEYWGGMYNVGRIQAQTYKFDYAVGTYEAPKNYGDPASCTYSFSTEHGSDLLILTLNNNNVNVQAHVGSDAAWTYTGDIAHCQSTNLVAEDCPYDVYLAN